MYPAGCDVHTRTRHTEHPHRREVQHKWCERRRVATSATAPAARDGCIDRGRVVSRAVSDSTKVLHAAADRIRAVRVERRRTSFRHAVQPERGVGSLGAACDGLRALGPESRDNIGDYENAQQAVGQHRLRGWGPRLSDRSIIIIMRRTSLDSASLTMSFQGSKEPEVDGRGAGLLASEGSCCMLTRSGKDGGMRIGSR